MKLNPATLNGYFRRLKHEYSMFCYRSMERRNRRLRNSWLKNLQHNPPDVLVGANFAMYGGVRGHIQAIQRYSSFNVQLAPPEKLMRQIGANGFSDAFRNDFLNFHAKGIRVVHSHVFPWFIEWCQHQQKSGLRWIHTYHLNYYPEHGRGGEVEPWQQQINDAILNQARFADVCLSVSKWQVKELRDRYAIESRYLPNGVDVAFCDQGRADRFRKKYGLDRFVLYVGRNDPVKNPQEFLQLAKRLPDVTFVMIGGGLSTETLVTPAEPVLPANLKIIGGVSPLEVQDALSACTLLVVTSKREGLPTLVLEAMAHGKPLVVADEPGCMEAIAHGQYGQIYRLGDLADLMKKVLLSLESGDRKHDARQRVLVEYDWSVVAPQLDQVYSAPR